jgi:hypothetical protein
MFERELSRPFVRAMRDVLDETGEAFEITGVGRLESRGDNRFLFTRVPGPRVFLSYIHEDVELVNRLRNDLHKAGLHPWMDRYEILPGQNWRRTIQTAIRISDFYVPCFSSKATRKRGTFQRELRYALQCNEEFPLDDEFVLPVRLDDCEVPGVIAAKFQYVDLFDGWDHGVARLILAIGAHMSRR